MVVLILILLEYGLRRVGESVDLSKAECLNPYSTGIWSATQAIIDKYSYKNVLILILLEYGLRPNGNVLEPNGTFKS